MDNTEIIKVLEEKIKLLEQIIELQKQSIPGPVYPQYPQYPFPTMPNPWPSYSPSIPYSPWSGEIVITCLNKV